MKTKKILGISMLALMLVVAGCGGKSSGGGASEGANAKQGSGSR